MKKFFSFAIALAMTLSVFTAHAETAAKFEISYTTASGDALDTTALKAGDTFYINIDLKSLSTMFGADAILSWDSSVIQLVNKNGADIAESNYKKPAGFTVSRAAKTIADEFEETFLSESAQYYPPSTDSTARAEYTAFTTDVTTLYQEDNSFLVYNFKVVSTGDAKIDFIGKVDDGQGAGSVNVTKDSIVPALTIGSVEPAYTAGTVEFEDQKQEGTVYGLKGKITPNDDVVTGVTFKVNNGTLDGDVTGMFADTIETAKITGKSYATFGVNITSIPEGITLNYVADSLAIVK